MLAPAIVLPASRRRVASSKTNPLGPGTVNFPLNIPKAEKELLGKLAFARGVSTNAFAKMLMVAGLQSISPEHAEKITEIRRQLKSSALILLIGFFTVNGWMTGEEIQMRRAARPVRARSQQGRKNEL